MLLSELQLALWLLKLPLLTPGNALEISFNPYYNCSNTFSQPSVMLM